MKGIVFNVVEAIIEDEFGASMWDRILANAGLDGVYTSLGNYPDDDLNGIVDAAAKILEMSSTDVLRWVGRRSMSRFRDIVPYIFDNYGNSEDFIKDVNNIIHPEVRKLYPGAGCPHFAVKATGPRYVSLVYNSQRHLCALAEGFIESSAELYGNQLSVHQTECFHKGDKNCVFVVEWAS